LSELDVELTKRLKLLVVSIGVSRRNAAKMCENVVGEEAEGKRGEVVGVVVRMAPQKVNFMRAKQQWQMQEE
jgi:hypothetical protein